MTNSYHLIIEKGNNKGFKIIVPQAGARLGRSSKNDIVISDPSLSRHHCRLFFKTNDGLWITDLGSANETMVNNVSVQESRIQIGNLITIGDTTMRVVNDNMLLTAEPVIDLGLSPDSVVTAGQKRLVGTKPLLIVGGLILSIAILAWIPGFLKKRTAEKQPVTVAQTDVQHELSLEINYEKVQATAKNIFRYKLQLDNKGLLSIEIDDLANNSHVRDEKNIDKELIQNLAKTIKSSPFFDLKNKYEGYHPGVFDMWVLSITIDKETFSSTVKNRMLPAPFTGIIESIEEFGKSELDLEAIQLPVEKRKEMALNASLLGKKLFSERSIKYDNLSSAIKYFSEAERYIKDIEPKPDYYKDIIAGLSKCKEEQQKQYDDLNFSAARAFRLREWSNAAEQLRIICELIPDRSDKRNKDARKRLILAEERLEADRK